jgi:hypothetical protein
VQKYNNCGRYGHVRKHIGKSIKNSLNNKKRKRKC